MKILYDSQIFRWQKFGGVSRYCAELIKGINTETDFTTFPGKFFSANKHLRSTGLTYFDFITDRFNFPGKYRIENFVRKIEDRNLIRFIKKGNFDLFHPTYYNPVLANYLPAKKPFVLTIHDMTYELYYDTHFNRIHEETKNKRNWIPKAAHIIAVSQNTKNDILKLFPEIDERKITVIYHGSSFSINIAESNIPLPSKYVLYVGKRGKYKNFLWLLHTIAAYLNRQNLILVCAGGRPFTEEEESLIRKLNLTGKVIYFNINTDNDLVAMYKKASCFIYPSSHEGFGIPILEAFSCGCPALLAKSSCFPEIAGNAALYFENGNEENLIKQLDMILEDPDLSKSLRQSGFERLQFFNWEKTVKQHIQVYQNVVSTSS